MNGFLERQAWKATEWLVRRFRSRDDAQVILKYLRLLLENQQVWTAALLLVEAVKSKNPLSIAAAIEGVKRAVEESER
jgi:hypothetical protein